MSQNTAKKFTKLISGTRRKTTVHQDRSLPLQFLSDKSRVVTSSAFRRLQAKAQVFSLEENAAVRTRLTHSIEVSLIGQIIAYRVFDQLCQIGEIPEELRIPFTSTVETACLLHDIGNPPFGHFGEAAIRKWVAEYVQKNYAKPEYSDYLSSIAQFDGNAQGFRIITRLQRHKNEFGLNLTCTQIAATIKYPKGSTSKINFFKVDEPIYKEVCDLLGMNELSRHPLSYLMEAADDIAYCLSDIEDGIEKRIVTAHDALESIIKNIKKSGNAEALDLLINLYSKATELEDEISKFIEFKVTLTQLLVTMATDAFMAQRHSILSGTQKDALITGTGGDILKAVKSFAKNKLFNSCNAYDIELSGHKIVTGILEALSPLLRFTENDFKALLNNEKVDNTALEQRLVWMLPKKHIKVYRDCTSRADAPEIVHRVHLLVDYVAGMTDTHALKVFQILNGIKIGVRT